MSLTKKNQEINSKSINKQWNQQKGNNTTKNTSYGILWYKRKSNYQKWNVCSGWFPLFKEQMVHSQAAKTWATHPASEWQYDFVPYISHPWLTNDNITLKKKNGWRGTSDVRWASWLAFVFVFVHVFGVWVWEIEGGDNGARRFTCRDKIVLMFLEKEKDKVNAVGTYHATFLISLEASCLFFLISDFTTAFGNQPVILFFCGCH